MRDYAKTGGRQGRPGYRTPSSYVARKTIHLWRVLIRRDMPAWDKELDRYQKQSGLGHTIR